MVTAKWAHQPTALPAPSPESRKAERPKSGKAEKPKGRKAKTREAGGGEAEKPRGRIGLGQADLTKSRVRLPHTTGMPRSHAACHDTATRTSHDVLFS